MREMTWSEIKQGPAAKAYLGDGVYVEFNEFQQLVLTTENGIAVQDTIYLDPEVWNALSRYAERVKKAVRRLV